MTSDNPWDTEAGHLISIDAVTCLTKPTCFTFETNFAVYFTVQLLFVKNYRSEDSGVIDPLKEIKYLKVKVTDPTNRVNAFTYVFLGENNYKIVEEIRAMKMTKNEPRYLTTAPWVCQWSWVVDDIFGL